MSARALENFIDALSLAESLVDLEGNYPDPPGGADESKGLGLRGGAAILMVGAFETFLRDLFLERLAPLTQQPPVVDFDKLPEKVRITSTWGALELALRGPRGGIRTAKIDRLPRVLRVSRVVGAEVISPDAFADTRANPGPQTVSEMFANVGMPDIFNRVRASFDALWPKPEADTFLQDKLEEVVQRRNAVAHRVDVRRITRQQLAEAPYFLTCLSAVLDEALEDYIRGLLQSCSP